MNEPAHFTSANSRSPAAMVVTMMMMPTMVMMTMPAMMAMPPSRLCRLRPDIFLDVRGSTGVAERQRVGTLDRRGKSEHGANGGKPQNFRHLHR